MKINIGFLFKRFRCATLWLMLLSMFFLLFGCGGNDSAPLGSPTGVFIDSAVEGLNYQTATFEGTTGSTGTFKYKTGEEVAFSIGNLPLGSAVGAEVLSPLSITPGAVSPAEQIVHNKLILFQTLDADGDVNNGIQITPAIRAIVSTNAGTINFDQAPEAFRASLAALMTELNNAGVFTDTYRGARGVKSASLALAHFTRSIGPRVTVSTLLGRLRGFEANATTWQWVGIPYAKPPVNDLRWKAPQALTAWTGIREATEWGDQAAQNPDYAAFGLGGVSEDCLYLNITAPKDAINLPVMVWFHGGAFGILTNNVASYNNAAALPTKGVVLVTVNHRLGAFGYLAHPLLTAESGYNGSGNYGQLDLIQALKWIKNNIRAFGGNPGNVTIFGQSGGGGKAISLMASPLAENLFHKVICESGIAVKSNPVLNHSSLAAAEAVGENLFNRLGVTTLAEARALSWLTIVMRDVTDFGALAWLLYKPNIDNRYLTDTMENLIKTGLANDVPFFAGANSGDLIAGADLAPGITEQMPWRSSHNSADQFVYYWSYVPAGWAAEPFNVSAYHGLELVYVFNYPASFVTHLLMGLPLKNNNPATPLNPIADLGIIPIPANYPALVASTGYGLADVQLTDRVMTAWTNFAKTGNPGVAGVIDWPAYTTANDTFVEIGAGGTFTVKTGLEAAFGAP